MTIKLAMTVNRKEDRGHDSSISVFLVPGMPDMIRIETDQGKLEFTLPEARVVSYMISEWCQVKSAISQYLAKQDDDDDY